VVYLKSMALPPQLDGLRVELDRLEYMSNPIHTHGQHQFVYYLNIVNNSSRTIKVLSRRWIVTDLETGQRLFVDGDGVVGMFPVLAPGEVFSYNSFHLVDHKSTAEGAYIVEDEDGEKFHVMIPCFELQLPEEALD
jgi:ApaG protein